MNIEEVKAFKDCKGGLICQLVGGSNLYGLNTPESDIDYRGLFVAADKKYTTGFTKIESIVRTGDVDATFYEITHFLKLLRKSNTQVMEILFAPDGAFTYKDEMFDVFRDEKYRLVDSNYLRHSLRGYVHSELRLATGERRGRLGGARKAAVDKYGFSPKNFVQILRLCKVGIEFFRDGGYMVNVEEFDSDYYKLLMDIKTRPEGYTKDMLKTMVDTKYEELNEIMDNSTIKYEFDIDLATEIVEFYRNKYEQK